MRWQPSPPSAPSAEVVTAASASKKQEVRSMECLCAPSWVWELLRGVVWVPATIMGFVIVGLAAKRRKGG